MKLRPPFSVTTNMSPDVRGMAYCVRDFNGWEVAYIPGIRGQACTGDLARRIAQVPEIVRALIDIRDSSACNAVAKARAAMALAMALEKDTTAHEAPLITPDDAVRHTLHSIHDCANRLGKTLDESRLRDVLQSLEALFEG